MPALPVHFVNPRSFIQLQIAKAIEFHFTATSDKLFLTCAKGSFEIVPTEMFINLFEQQYRFVYDDGVIRWTEGDIMVYESYLIFTTKEMECPICYEEFKTDIVSKCGHCACEKCMVKMCQANVMTCPMCRSDAFRFPIAVAIGHYIY